MAVRRKKGSSVSGIERTLDQTKKQIQKEKDRIRDAEKKATLQKKLEAAKKDLSKLKEKGKTKTSSRKRRS
jgi:hypothetical protein